LGKTLYLKDIATSNILKRRYSRATYFVWICDVRRSQW
jgi:hypothetical protein